MAFSSSFTKQFPMGNGMILQKYAWDGATATSGTITLQTTEQPEVYEVLMATASNDADNAAVVALDSGSNKVKITFTSGDSGTVEVIGIAR